MPPGSPSKLATYAESSSGSRSSTSATSAIHKTHPPQDRVLYPADQLIAGRRDQPLHRRIINPRWLQGESMHTEIGVAARRIDDPEPVAVFVDETHYFGSRGSSSLAKKADAALRISLARRSSRTSFSSSAIRCWSLVVIPGR